MPSIKARTFQQVFSQAFADGARLSQHDVEQLTDAAAQIRDHKESAAATELLKLVKDDHVLDKAEVGAARKALCKLLGTSPNGLPKELEKILAHAAPLPNVRVAAYDLSFDFSKDAPSFPARALVLLEEPSTKQAILEVDPERLSIQSVAADGVDVPFKIVGGRLVVTADNARALDIKYRVTPTEDPHGYGLIRDKFANRMWTLTWPYNTGALFPSSSHPNDGATAKVTVKVGAGTDVVGGGKKHKDGAFHYDEEVPAYALAFYAGAFTDQKTTRAKGTGVDVVTQGLAHRMSPEARKEARDLVAGTVAMMSDWFGKYPMGDTLNLVEVDHDYGGMEHAGAVAVTVGDRKEYVEAAVHEAIHHWFGDGVRIQERGEYWMSEGFTQYCTFRSYEQQRGGKAMHAMYEDSKQRLKDALLEGPAKSLSSTDPAAAYDDFFTDVAYHQGPWMLRMLEGRFGREKFDGVLKDWYGGNRGKAVTTADFVAHVKKATGEDLTAWFKAWNTVEAVPTYRDESSVQGGKLKVHLIAKAPLPAGTLLPVVVKGSGGESATLWVDPKTRPVLEAPFPIKSFRWDPDMLVLADVR